MNKQVNNTSIAEVIKDNDEVYKTGNLIDLNKYKFYLTKNDVTYNYTTNVNIPDNVIYLSEGYYYFYKNAELAGYNITFLINRNTFKSIMKDINSNNDDFTKKCYAITFRIDDRTFYFLKGYFKLTDNSNKENILINCEIKETMHEFKKALKVKNKYFKSSVKGIVLDERYKNKKITRILTPDDFNKIKNNNKQGAK